MQAALAGAGRWEWDVFALDRLVPDRALSTACWYLARARPPGPGPSARRSRSASAPAAVRCRRPGLPRGPRPLRDLDPQARKHPLLPSPSRGARGRRGRGSPQSRCGFGSLLLNHADGWIMPMAGMQG